MRGYDELTTARLDYLQRTASTLPPPDPRSPITFASPDRRRLIRVTGVGRHDRPAAVGEPFRLISKDLLVGLYNYTVPVALQVTGAPGMLDVQLGSWLVEGRGGNLRENLRVLGAGLSSIYPVVDLAAPQSPVAVWELGGTVLGVPTATAPDAFDGALPWDRIVRALAGAFWSVLVLAQPIDERGVRDLRAQVLNEMRAVAGEAAAGPPSPLAEHYLDLLRMTLNAFSESQGTGLWRTAVYLAGDHHSYYRLASVWRGTFSGELSLPEPVRVFDQPGVPALIRQWGLPDQADRGRAPGHYVRPFEYQTALTSSQLASYVHLPGVETPGFAVHLVPEFDAVPARVRGRPLALGAVVERDTVSAAQVAVDLDHLTMHAFVTGVTGSGKTNTVMNLLLHVDEAQVPFLVLEPAKTEYRALLEHPRLAPRLTVLTLANELVSPLRINPFEFPDGIPVGVHIDLLRSVFAASFGMWTPLPQVLERCLHEVYADRGWDVITSSNRRLVAGGDRWPAFPTLSDLAAKVDAVSGQLGYEQRVTDDIRAALTTRLMSLRSGGKGWLLDVPRSSPIQALLTRPAVLELEGLGDDDDKALVMGLLVTRLAEERRCQGPRAGLQHLLVIEEAHRLLAATAGRRAEYESDVRGKAVETFGSLLAEVRAYGQGVLVVDQIPTKLSGDVLKSTNVKLAHRIVSGDDRAVLGAAMGMKPEQERALATLPLGRAAFFAEGEDVPLLVQVPKVEGLPAGPGPHDGAVRRAMAPQATVWAVGRRTASCRDGCATFPDACAAAREALAAEPLRRTLARLMLSTITDDGALERRLPELITSVDPARPPGVDRSAFLAAVCAHGAGWLGERRGVQAEWTYPNTAAVVEAMACVLLDGVAGRDAHAARTRLLAALEEADRRPEPHSAGSGAATGTFGPFPLCRWIWAGVPGPCQCRFPVADLVSDGRYDLAWSRAATADATHGSERRTTLWQVCQDVAYQAVEFPEPDWADDLRQPVTATARRVALCAGQQLLARERNRHPRSKQLLLAELWQEAEP